MPSDFNKLKEDFERVRSSQGAAAQQSQPVQTGGTAGYMNFLRQVLQDTPSVRMQEQQQGQMDMRMYKPETMQKVWQTGGNVFVPQQNLFTQMQIPTRSALQTASDMERKPANVVKGSAGSYADALDSFLNGSSEEAQERRKKEQQQTWQRFISAPNGTSGLQARLDAAMTRQTGMDAADRRRLDNLESQYQGAASARENPYMSGRSQYLYTQQYDPQEEARRSVGSTTYNLGNKAYQQEMAAYAADPAQYAAIRSSDNSDPLAYYYAAYNLAVHGQNPIAEGWTPVQDPYGKTLTRPDFTPGGAYEQQLIAGGMDPQQAARKTANLQEAVDQLWENPTASPIINATKGRQQMLLDLNNGNYDNYSQAVFRELAGKYGGMAEEERGRFMGAADDEQRQLDNARAVEQAAANGERLDEYRPLLRRWLTETEKMSNEDADAILADDETVRAFAFEQPVAGSIEQLGAYTLQEQADAGVNTSRGRSYERFAEKMQAQDDFLQAYEDKHAEARENEDYAALSRGMIDTDAYVAGISDRLAAIENDPRFHNGNVGRNLADRPEVQATQENIGVIRQWNPDAEIGDVSTVLSTEMTFGEGENAVTLIVTPIKPDGSWMTPEEMDDYLMGLQAGDVSIDELLAGDRAGYSVIQGAVEGGDDAAIALAGQYGETKHELHAAEMLQRDRPADGYGIRPLRYGKGKAVIENKDVLAVYLAMGATSEQTGLYATTINGAPGMTLEEMAQKPDSVNVTGVRYMSRQQRQDIAYAYNTGGMQAAIECYQDMLPDLNRKRQKAMGQETAEWVRSGGFWTAAAGSEATVAANPLSGAIGTFAAIANAFGADIDPNDPMMDLPNYINNVRQTAGAMAADLTDWEILGQNVGTFGYNVLMSMQDNFMAGIIGQGTASMLGGSISMQKAQDLAGDMVQLIMSSEATATAYAELLGKNPNADKTQLAWLAIADGMMEAATEKWSFQNLYMPQEGRGKLHALGVGFWNAFFEGTEEWHGDVIKLIGTEVLSSMDNSQVAAVQGEVSARASELYLLHPDWDEAQCQQEAWASWCTEAAMSFAAGFAAGAGESAITNGINAAMNHHLHSITGGEYANRNMSAADSDALKRHLMPNLEKQSGRGNLVGQAAAKNAQTDTLLFEGAPESLPVTATASPVTGETEARPEAPGQNQGATERGQREAVLGDRAAATATQTPTQQTYNKALETALNLPDSNQPVQGANQNAAALNRDAQKQTETDKAGNLEQQTPTQQAYNKELARALNLPDSSQPVQGANQGAAALNRDAQQLTEADRGANLEQQTPAPETYDKEQEQTPGRPDSNQPVQEANQDAAARNRDAKRLTEADKAGNLEEQVTPEQAEARRQAEEQWRKRIRKNRQLREDFQRNMETAIATRMEQGMKEEDLLEWEAQQRQTMEAVFAQAEIEAETRYADDLQRAGFSPEYAARAVRELTMEDKAAGGRYSIGDSTETDTTDTTEPDRTEDRLAGKQIRGEAQAQTEEDKTAAKAEQTAPQAEQGGKKTSGARKLAERLRQENKRRRGTLTGSMDTLVRIANTLDARTDAKKTVDRLAKKYQGDMGRMKNSEIGELLMQTRQALDEQSWETVKDAVTAGLRKQLEPLGMDDLPAVLDAGVKLAMGERLTRREQKAVSQNGEALDIIQGWLGTSQNEERNAEGMESWKRAYAMAEGTRQMREQLERGSIAEGTQVESQAEAEAREQRTQEQVERRAEGKRTIFNAAFREASGKIIRGLTNDENGKAAVQVRETGEDGSWEDTAVSLEDVEFADEEQQAAYEAAVSIAGQTDIAAGRSFLTAWQNSGDIALDAFKRGFDAVFDAARAGTRVSPALRAVADMLPEAARLVADKSGKEFDIREAERMGLTKEGVTETDGILDKAVKLEPLAKQDQTLKGYRDAVDGKVDADYHGVVLVTDTTKMTRQKKLQAVVLDALAKRFNLQIILADSFQQGKNATKGVQGEHNPATGMRRLWVALDAEGDNLTGVTGHESFHMLKRIAEDPNAPKGMAEAVQQLEDTILQTMAEQGMDIQARIKEKTARYMEAGQEMAEVEAREEIEKREKDGETLTEDEKQKIFKQHRESSKALTEAQAREEIAGDGMFGVLDSEAGVRWMARHTEAAHGLKGILQKIAGVFRKVAARLTRINTEARKMLAAPQERIQQVLDLYERVLEMSKNVQGTAAASHISGETGTQGETNRRFSFMLPSGKEFTMTEEEVNSARDSVIRSEIVGEVSGNDFQRIEGVSLEDRLSAYFASIGGGVNHSLLGWIKLEKSGAHHYTRHMNNETVPAIPLIKNVIEKGVIVDIGSHKNIGEPIVIAAKVKIANELYFMAVAVRQIRKNDNRYYMHSVALADLSGKQKMQASNQQLAPISPAMSWQGRYASVVANDPHHIINILQDLQKRNSQSGKNENSSGELSITSDEEYVLEKAGEIAPTSDARLSLAGEYAAEEFSKDVQEAKRLEAEGETDEEITRKTGCIRGFRGRWWRVLDNSRMRLRDVSAIEPDREYRLDEVYQAEELYRAYPLIGYTPVTFTKLRDGLAGQRRSGNELFFSTDLLEGGRGELLEEVLQHEIQHIIQNVEGSWKGSSATEWGTIINTLKARIAYAEGEISDVLRRYEIDEEDLPFGLVFNDDGTLDEGYIMTPEAQEKAGNLPKNALRELRRIKRNIDGWKSLTRHNRYPADLYWNTVGEIEARAAARTGNAQYSQISYGEHPVAIEDWADARGPSYSVGERSGDETGEGLPGMDNPETVALIDRLQRQIRQLQEQTGSKPTFARARLEEIARQLRDDYKTSGMSVKAIADRLESIYTTIAMADNTAEVQGAVAELISLGQEVLEQTEVVDDSTDTDDAAYARKYLRGKRFRLTENQVEEIRHAYGSMKEFRRLIAGSGIRIARTNDTTAPTLDSLWPSFASDMGESLFPMGISDGDEPVALVRALDSIMLQKTNPFKAAYESGQSGMSIGDLAEQIGWDLFGAYMETEQTNTNSRLQRQLADTAQELDETRQGAMQTIRQLQQESRKEREQLRKRAERAEQRMTNHLKRETRDSLVNQTNRIANAMQRKLDRPGSNTGFVPPPMQDAVRKLLSCVLGTKEVTVETVLAAKDAYQKMQTQEGAIGGELAQEMLADTLANFDILIAAAQQGRTVVDVNMRRTDTLTNGELIALENILSVYQAAIANANRMFTQSRKATLQQMGERMIDELTPLAKGRNAKARGPIDAWFKNAVIRGLMKPVTAFERLKGTAAWDVWTKLRGAEGKHIRHAEAAGAYMSDALEQFHQQESINLENSKRKHSDGKKTGQYVQTFTLESGETLKLTDQERMTLYAYAKREALVGTNHLLGGGITIGNPSRGDSLGVFRLTSNDIASIIGSLTQEQKGFVDHMVAFLSTTCAQWGNEVTRQLYGIDKFTEEYYLPFTVNQSYVQQTVGVMQDSRMKTGSFTKMLTEKASTPLELMPFTQLWSSHVEKMSDYNAFVLPLEDLNRLLNYRRGIYDENGQFIARGPAVRPTMDQAYGKELLQYIQSFMKRMNGNSKAEFGSRWVNTLISKAKGAAVTGNLSVAMQQAGAGIRAMAELSPLDMMRGIAVVGLPVLNVRRVNRIYAELEQYAAIAVEKGWGYFDTNMSQGLYDRAKQGRFDRIEGIMSWGAEYGDKFNWTQIWEACKAETRRLYPSLSEEGMLQKAGERFQEVIDRTQVVDSVFQRCEFATEKGKIAPLMAFMSEPVTQYNMILRSILEWNDAKKVGDKEGMRRGRLKLARNTLSIAISAMLTAALKTVVTALRGWDDDEEKEIGPDGKPHIVRRKGWRTRYREQYFRNVWDNFTGLTTVFGNLINDAISTMGGGDLTTSAITALYRGCNNLVKAAHGQDVDWEKTGYYFLQSFSNMTGVGFHSAYRDTRSIERTIYDHFNEDMKAGSAWDTSKDVKTRLGAAEANYIYKKTDNPAIDSGKKVNSQVWLDLLYEAWKQDGYGPLFEQVADAALTRGASQSALESGLKKRINEGEGRIHEAAEALNNGDLDTYNRLTQELIDDGMGERSVNNMVISEWKDLQPEADPGEPETGKSLIKKMTAEQGNAKTAARTAGDAAYKAAVEGDDPAALNAAVAQLRKVGVSEKDLRTKVSTSYKKDYSRARIFGDTERANHLAAMAKGAGVNITDSDLNEWATDQAYSAKDWGIYDSLRSGDGTTARQVRQWLYSQPGANRQKIDKRIANWCQTQAKKGGDMTMIHDALVQMGYSNGTAWQMVKVKKKK